MVDISSFPVWALLLLLLLGVGGLSLGGDLLCRGAVGVALKFKVRPIVIGLTLVSFATSTPELFTAFFGAAAGSDGLVTGTIVGSNIGNIGLILGISALICPLVIHLQLVRREVPILIGVTLIFAAMSWGGLQRWEGGVLVACFLCYLVYLLRRKEGGSDDAEEVTPQWAYSLPVAVFFIVGGTVALLIGASFLVDSAVELSGRLGVSERVVGLTLVAVGTSLPEMATSVAAALHKQADLCAGNIVGSNLFNLTLIGGSVVLFYPLEVEAATFLVDIPVMLLFTLLLWPFFFTGKIVSRREGICLLLFYAGFIAATTL